MTLHTARLSLPYPETSDTADVPRDVGALAQALDSSVPYLEGVLAERPAASRAGRLYRAVDTGAWSLDTGTAWLDIRTGADKAAYSGLQDGVIDAGSYEVTAGGANTVNVASNSGAGAILNQALIPPTSAITNVVLGPPDASNPRIDRIVVAPSGVVSVVFGTPTAPSGGVSASLDNLAGAAPVPAGSLLLADVLVSAGSVAISNGQIRDRRRWARGAYCKIVKGSSFSLFSNTAGGFAYIDQANLNPRIECSGAPLIITLEGVQSASNAASYWDIAIDTVAVSIGTKQQNFGSGVSGGPLSLATHLRWTYTPTPGSHRFGPIWGKNPGDFTATGPNITGPVLTIQELVRQDTANNRTTTG